MGRFLDDGRYVETEEYEPETVVIPGPGAGEAPSTGLERSYAVPKEEVDRIEAVIASRATEVEEAAEALRESQMEQQEARAQAVSDAREQRDALEAVARAAWIEAGGAESSFGFRYSVIYKRFLDDAVVQAMLDYLEEYTS